MLELNKAIFQKALKSRVPILVDFWAPWCGPCRIIGPMLKKLESEFSNKLKFSKLNVDENQELASKFNVRGIPCMVIFKNSKEVGRIVGAFSEDELRRKIDLVLSKI